MQGVLGQGFYFLGGEGGGTAQSFETDGNEQLILLGTLGDAKEAKFFCFLGLLLQAFEYWLISSCVCYVAV